MIKLKLSEIVGSIEVFNKIMTQSFKGSLAFKIARLARELSKEMDTFNEERMKVIKKYCVKDENGEPVANEDGSVKIPDENIVTCNNEFMGLLDTEVEINADKISMDCIDDFNLTPQEISSLEVFFE